MMIKIRKKHKRKVEKAKEKYGINKDGERVIGGNRGGKDSRDLGKN